MLHEPCRTVGRQSTLLHAVQHGGVSCMGITNPPLALSGHASQFRAETLCSAKRGKGKGVRGALPHGGWESTGLRTDPCLHRTHDECCPLVGQTSHFQKVAPAGWGAGQGGQNTGLRIVARPHQTHSECCPFAG